MNETKKLDRKEESSLERFNEQLQEMSLEHSLERNEVKAGSPTRSPSELSEDALQMQAKMYDQRKAP